MIIVEMLYKFMNNSLKGLTDDQVLESRSKHGSNILTPPQKSSILKLFLEKFNDPIIKVLIIAALLSLVISLIHNEFAETIGIIVAILLSTTIGFWFEYDADKKFDLLNTVNDQTSVRVRRNGEVQSVVKSDIVVGDIVLLESGEEVPADGTLLESLSLSVNESSLTGELLTSKSHQETLLSSEATYPSNRVLRSSTIIEGSGVMVVDSVGDDTEFGKVATASTQKSEEQTPLTKQLDKLASLIGLAGFSIAIATFFLMLFQELFFGITEYNWIQKGSLLGSLAIIIITIAPLWIPLIMNINKLLNREIIAPLSVTWRQSLTCGVCATIALIASLYALSIDPFSATSWISLDGATKLLDAFMIAVTLIVVAVPEGLPMSVTLSLALNMRRMLKNNNLVRKMHACETMGAINVICTDKTGTLTQNRMSVAETNFEFSKIIAEAIAVNTTAHLNHGADGSVNSVGNPTESALLFYLMDRGVDYNIIRDSAPPIERIPFSTEHKYMATLVKSQIDGSNIIYIKGAPEVILSLCSNETNDDTKQLLLDYQSRTMRTLAFCYKVINSDSIASSIESKEFSLLGIIAINDPIRKDVPMAIMSCHDAGIDVKIITGDTSATATEIAKRIGLWKDGDNERNHISGTEFEAYSDDELLEMVSDIKVISRARPSDKQRFVRLLQKLGRVVAVTGDGTNDAPALNYAQVGLSMGSGTSVAKQASDITLIDDSFSSITTAVMWGRSLYKNIQRFLIFQLTINVIAVAIVFLGIFFSGETPLTITQMLWVNLIMDTFAAAALASLPPSKSVMKDKPRRNEDFIITKAMRRIILGTGGAISATLTLFWLFIESSPFEERALLMSIFFSVFVLIQFWNMFNVKSFGTSNSSSFRNLRQCKSFIFVSLIILIGQIAIVSFGGEMFRVIPLSVKEWIIIILGTSTIFWVVEISKKISRLTSSK